MDAYLLWLIAGFTLLIVEMVTGTFYLLVLGIACFGAAVAAFLGQGFPVQIVLAAAVSGAGAYAVHSWRRISPASRMQSIDAGMPARFESWTDRASGRARVRYRDASWDARVEGSADLEPGAIVYVRTLDGNTLLVGPHPPG